MSKIETCTLLLAGYENNEEGHQGQPDLNLIAYLIDLNPWVIRGSIHGLIT